MVDGLADALADEAELIAPEDPQDILAVPIEGHGWASAGNVTRFYRGWLRERVGELDAPTAEQLTSALRAAFDL